MHLPILTWDKEKYGTTMKYTWIEQDESDSKTELNITANSNFGEDDDVSVNGSVKITISAKDDEAGESIVEYQDKTSGEGTEYRTGIVRFWINQ